MVITRLKIISIIFILHIISHFIPGLIEQFYSSFLFIFFVGFFQLFSSVSSFPFFYILLISAVLYLGWLSKRNYFTIFIGMVNLFLVLVCWFYISWGLNYSRLDIQKKLSLTETPVADSMYGSMLKDASRDLNGLRALIHARQIQYKTDANLLKKINEQTRVVFERLGYKTPEKVVVKKFWPKGLLLRLSTAGFYFPFFAECYYDPGLHPLQLPFVVAHECAHGYGIGDEGTCNFIAYLTCMSIPDTYVQYSAKIAYWKTLKNIGTNKNILKTDLLNQQVMSDLEQIKSNMDLYPDVFPEVRDWIYNSFLKFQGISEGEENYDRFIDLLYHFDQKRSAEK